MALNYNNSCAHRRTVADSRPQSGTVEIDNHHNLFLSRALFKIGDVVSHVKFGIGVVASHCFSPDQPVTIDFGGAKKSVLPNFISTTRAAS